MLRETGFKPEDAMGDDERKAWLLRKIATGSTSPEQTQAALRILGADLGIVTPSESNREIAPVLDNKRSLEGHPVQQIPDRERSEADRASREDAAASARAATIAAADVLVFRALERVGNRLCSGARKAELSNTPAQWRYMYVDAVPESALEGAWGFAGEVLEQTGNMADTARVCAALDGYVRFILNDRRKHHRDYLEAALIAAGVIEP
jgi:hypothetical protein